MPSKKRLFALLLVSILVFTLTFTACGGNNQPAPAAKDNTQPASTTSSTVQSAPAESSAGPSQTATVTHYSINSEDKSYIGNLMPEFEKAHPNIKMKFLTAPYENFDTKLQTLVASGSPPDVTSHYGDGGYIEFYNKNIIMDLTPLIQKSSFNAAEIGIPENLMNIYKTGGKQYGIPVSAYVSLLVYNKDMFDKAGIPYPPSDYEDRTWTFDKMVDTAKKLTKVSKNQAETQYGLVWSWNERDMNPVYFGAKPYSDDTWSNGGFPSQLSFDSPEYIKATQRLNDLIYVDKVSPTPAIAEGLAGGPNASGDAFTAGKVAMVVTGAWEIAGIADLPFKAGVAAVPVGSDDKARDVLYVDPLMILKGSKSPEAAFEWIKFLVSQEAQEKAIELAGNPPANTKAAEKYYSSFSGVDPKDMKNVQEGGIKYGIESYNHLVGNYSQVISLVRNEFAPMDNENVPAEQVCKIVQKKVTDLFKTAKK